MVEFKINTYHILNYKYRCGFRAEFIHTIYTTKKSKTTVTILTNSSPISPSNIIADTLLGIPL
jgi:hypothetical protein